MDVKRLRQAWSDIQDAIDSMEEGGWGTNAEFIADIWGATALMLGKQNEALPLMSAVASAASLTYFAEFHRNDSRPMR